MATKSISQERLKELLSYNPSTGVFTWKVDDRRTAKIGEVAGCVTLKGYRMMCIDNTRCTAGRLAWLYVYGEYPLSFIDHIDRNKDNNAIDNLRDVSNRTNCKNRSLRSDNVSGMTGVRETEYGKWEVSINYSNGRFSKTYATFSEAKAVREALKIVLEYHHSHGV